MQKRNTVQKCYGETKKQSNALRPVMGSAPPVSKLPREEMLLRPLGRAGEPDTAAGLITAMERHQNAGYSSQKNPNRNCDSKS